MRKIFGLPQYGYKIEDKKYCLYFFDENEKTYHFMKKYETRDRMKKFINFILLEESKD